MACTRDVEPCPPSLEKVLDLLVAGVLDEVHSATVSPMRAPSEMSTSKALFNLCGSSVNDGSDGWGGSRIRARKAIFNMLVLGLENTHYRQIGPFYLALVYLLPI
jgi:hypothetical protein